MHGHRACVVRPAVNPNAGSLNAHNHINNAYFLVLRFQHRSLLNMNFNEGLNIITFMLGYFLGL